MKFASLWDFTGQAVDRIFNHESAKVRKLEKERIHHPLIALARGTEDTESSKLFKWVELNRCSLRDRVKA